jgi:hypothetical protein
MAIARAEAPPIVQAFHRAADAAASLPPVLSAPAGALLQLAARLASTLPRALWTADVVAYALTEALASAARDEVVSALLPGLRPAALSLLAAMRPDVPTLLNVAAAGEAALASGSRLAGQLAGLREGRVEPAGWMDALQVRVWAGRGQQRRAGAARHRHRVPARAGMWVAMRPAWAPVWVQGMLGQQRRGPRAVVSACARVVALAGRAAGAAPPSPGGPPARRAARPCRHRLRARRQRAPLAPPAPAPAPAPPCRGRGRGAGAQQRPGAAAGGGALPGAAGAPRGGRGAQLPGAAGGGPGGVAGGAGHAAAQAAGSAREARACDMRHGATAFVAAGRSLRDGRAAHALVPGVSCGLRACARLPTCGAVRPLQAVLEALAVLGLGDERTRRAVARVLLALLSSPFAAEGACGQRHSCPGRGAGDGCGRAAVPLFPAELGGVTACTALFRVDRIPRRVPARQAWPSGASGWSCTARIRRCRSLGSPGQQLRPARPDSGRGAHVRPRQPRMSLPPCGAACGPAGGRAAGGPGRGGRAARPGAVTTQRWAFVGVRGATRHVAAERCAREPARGGAAAGGGAGGHARPGRRTGGPPRGGPASGGAASPLALRGWFRAGHCAPAHSVMA